MQKFSTALATFFFTFLAITGVAWANPQAGISCNGNRVLQNTDNSTADKLASTENPYSSSTTKKTAGDATNGIVPCNGNMVTTPIPQSKNSITATNSHYAYNNSPVTYYQTDTGGHYVIVSKTGFNGASGNIQLPSIKMVGITDTAYQMFGVYTDIAGADLGIWSKDNKNWYIGVTLQSPYGIGPSTWYSSSKAIVKSEHPQLYMVVRVYDNYLSIRVCDGVNYKYLDSLTINAPDRGFNAAGNGVRISREHALAYYAGQGDLGDGSYMLNSKWWNVYIYSNGGFSLWTSDHTDSRMIKDTADEQRTVHLTGLRQDYQDTCSIEYNLSRIM